MTTNLEGNWQHQVLHLKEIPLSVMASKLCLPFKPYIFFLDELLRWKIQHFTQNGVETNGSQASIL